MKRKMIFAFIFLAAGLYAQAPQFEVATLKLLPPGERNRALTADGVQVHYPSVNLLNLLREAYRLRSREQVDGPAWMVTQMYSIEAKLPAGASKDQIPEMLQALLADRLKLSVHHDSRPMQTNVLLVSKKGPKMHQVEEEDEILDLDFPNPLVHLTGKGSMAKLIDQFNHGVGGKDSWVDMTGLKGFYQIKLDYALDGPVDSPLFQSDDVRDVPKLPEALEQQLGLRTELRKEPTEIVVVDHVERNPVEN